MTEPQPAGWHRHPATGKRAWWTGKKWGNPPPGTTPWRNQNAVNAFGLGIASLLLLFIPFVGPVIAAVAAILSVVYGIVTFTTTRRYQNRGLLLGMVGFLLGVLTLFIVWT
jgi:VanZ family protein